MNAPPLTVVSVEIPGDPEDSLGVWRVLAGIIADAVDECRRTGAIVRPLYIGRVCIGRVTVSQVPAPPPPPRPQSDPDDYGEFPS
jgi:hypothetical protein